MVAYLGKVRGVEKHHDDSRTYDNHHNLHDTGNTNAVRRSCYGSDGGVKTRQKGNADVDTNDCED